MKHQNFSQNYWPAKLLWGMTMIMALFVLSLSFFRSLSFSLSKWAVLATAAFVAIIICQYRSKIPRTRINFSAEAIFAFWGIIWLGISGGVILGAIATTASCYKVRDRKSQCIFEICVDTIATFLAGFVFYLASGLLPGYNIESVNNNLVFNENLIAAIVLMALARYVLTSSLTYLFYRNETTYTIRQILSETVFLSSVTYLLTIPATIISLFVFIRFGIEFGLVIVPMAVIGSLLYTLHARSLAIKTKQITDASRIHLATVEALATAIDARDQVGVGHVRRTQIYAIGIGEVLGLSEDEINALRTGALLHDIGKLAVPDHILNKNGKLTNAEVEKIKIHASVGASILEKVGFNYPVVPTVKYHHERWDGSGYPEALRGENIPLTARILSVADAYDTLRGERTYRPAVSREEACSHLRSKAGTWFDPRIVAVFLKNLKSFEVETESQGLSYRAKSHEDSSDAVSISNLKPSYVDQIKRANHEVFTLYELAREFSSSLSLGETLSLFTSRIRDFVPFDTCVIYLWDEKTSTATAAYVAGENQQLFNQSRIVAGQGVTGQALLKGLAMQNEDPELDLQLIHPGIISDYKLMVSLPLLAEENLVGAVSLYSTEMSYYGEEHLRLLETISRIAADAISKSLLHDEAQTNALTDPITGLPNARNLQLQYEKEVARASRSDSSFHVLMMDLDGFKAVNDTFGHKAGDEMLTGIGKVIRKQLREYDFLARYAGDEFVAIIPDTRGEEILDLCRRIDCAVNAFELVLGDLSSKSKVGISIGAASFPDHGSAFDQIIVAADKAMYAKKIDKKKIKAARDFIESLPIPKPDTFLPPAIPIPDSVFTPSIYDRGFDLESLRVVDVSDEGLIVELDETHVVSAAIN